MKFFTRVALFSLVFSLSPLSYLYAQDDVTDNAASKEDVKIEENATKDGGTEGVSENEEEGVLTLEEAAALIDSLPTSGDAVTGKLRQNSDRNYYDIHGRRLAFREGAKDLRASLEERREAFEAPRVEAVERDRDVTDKVYKAEMSAYKENESEAKKTEDEASEDTDGAEIDAGGKNESSADDQATGTEEASEEQPSGNLNEKSIPPKEGEEDGAPKRKVITSDDAPDFDPSNL